MCTWAARGRIALHARRASIRQHTDVSLLTRQTMAKVHRREVARVCRCTLFEQQAAHSIPYRLAAWQLHVNGLKAAALICSLGLVNGEHDTSSLSPALIT